MPACSSLKMPYQSGPESLSMASTAALLSSAPSCVQADSSVAARSVIGPRTDWANCWRGDRVLLLLDGAHAQHQPRDAVVLVDLEHPVGEMDRLVDIAVGQHRQEGAVEQLGILRIGAQRRAVVGGRRAASRSMVGMAGGQVAAGGGHARQVLRVGVCADGCAERPWSSAMRASGEPQPRAEKVEGHGSVISIGDLATRRTRPLPVGRRGWPFCAKPARIETAVDASASRIDPSANSRYMAAVAVRMDAGSRPARARLSEQAPVDIAPH